MSRPAFTSLRAIVRGLVRRPIFSIAAILTLALGVGANTAVVTVVRSVLIRPLPYAQPGRLVAIWPGKFVANRELAGIRSRSVMLEEAAGFSPGWLMGLTGVPNPVQLNAARVSGNMFSMLGARAALGQPFGPEADHPGFAPVAVLSDPAWRDQFGGDPAIIGRSITLDGTGYQVIAVMPPGFQMFDVETDLWVSLPMDPSAMTWAGSTAVLYGRLAPTATVAMATAEMATIARGIRDEFSYPADWDRGLRVEGLKENLVGGLRTMLLVLTGAVTFLLLIAVANVAGLFTLRAVERGPELAVRVSLGAGRRQIVALLLAESAVIAGVGGALGIGLGVGGVTLLRRILPSDLPRLGELAIDGPTLSVSIAVTALAALVFGLAPVLGRRLDQPYGQLREGRTVAGGHRTRGSLVAIEVALTVVLLIGSGLMVRSLLALTSVDPGLKADHLLTMRLQPGGFDSAEELRAYWRDVLTRVRETPGVVSAATILHLPTSGRTWGGDVQVEGRPLAPGASPPRTAWQATSTGYFETAGVPVVAGRTFTEADRADAPPVVVVNQAFAATIFPGEDPIGRRIKAGNATGDVWTTIVGVVGGVRHDSLSVAPKPEVYRPFEQRTVGANSLVVRTRGAPEGLAAVIRESIWAVSRDVPISQVRTMEGMFRASLTRPRVIASLLAGFSGLGMLLGVVGVFGIAASWARARDRELAVRVALGADAGRVTRLVVSQALGYAAMGLVLGLVAAVGLSGSLRGLLYGVTPVDPATFAGVALVLGGFAALAAWIPARRAARAEPTAVLRS